MREEGAASKAGGAPSAHGAAPGASPRREAERRRFPGAFLWGAATSSYQIEGSPLADGAGESIWHRFSHTPGRTDRDDTGDIACDHYRRYPEDVALMRELGLGAYRLSLAWSRILPDGAGRVNSAGVDFYSRLVDLLLESGIRPFVTLFHWDLPQALEDRGGWLVWDSAEWFAEYARVAFEALGDRVTLWATINEPFSIVDAGYLRGVHAPGRHSPAEAARAARHLLRAHGAAVRVGRAAGRHEIGIVLNLEPQDPASEDPADVAAAARMDAYVNRQFLEPLLLGRTPDAMPEVFGEAWPGVSDDDLALIGQPIDYLGVNYYTRRFIRHDHTAPFLRATRVRLPGREYTPRGWEISPENLVRVLRDVKERYGDIPLYIAENGAAFDDPPSTAGSVVEDPLRARYLREHVAAAREAIRQGVDLRGYFAWSLLDNFEWNHGYSMRFGLVHVDFGTQQRTLKRSALDYREIVRTNGADLAP